MNQSADDIWRSIVNGIGLELQTHLNALSSWAEILDGILDQFQDEEESMALQDSTPLLTADELLDDIREAIKRFDRFEDQLRDEFLYRDQGSSEA